MNRTLAAALLGTALLLNAGQSLAQDVTQDPAKVQSGTYEIEPTHTKVIFAINHLGYSTYYGAFPKAEGTLVLNAADPAKSVLNVTVDVTAISTDLPALNEHLLAPDFFDAAKFPKATFKSTKVEPAGKNKAKVTGDLTLKGVTKPVTLDVTFNQAGPNFINKVYSVGFDATTTIKRSDFGVSAYVPAVGDEVTLRIGSELQLKK
ncbi:YceI family protein [Niveispirillum irakense]|uniref:YceI family protein n=1 Tax=Niveispirillum irakense TaxID=34011 RepID=UPI000417B47A|nr:YceI family protein [Niveispirillum irakense]